jgi:hypothetical protein
MKVPVGPSVSSVASSMIGSEPSVTVSWPGRGTVFLPFDFSDQCTAWLRVSSANGRSAEVSAGWSSVEGWAVMPSDFGSFANAVDDFAPIAGASVDTGMDDLVVAIATTRDALRRQPGEMP